MADKIATTMQDTSSSSSAHLTKLPEELLLKVARHLRTIEDVMGFRLSNKLMARVGYEALFERMTTIYIEQTPESISHFKNICGDPDRAKHINKIIYILPLQNLSNERIREHIEYWDHQNEVNEELLDTLVNMYAKRREEQKVELEERTLVKALTETVSLLPNLKKIDLQDRPRLHYHPEGSYNAPTGWRRHMPKPTGVESHDVFNDNWQMACYHCSDVGGYKEILVPIFEMLAAIPRPDRDLTVEVLAPDDIVNKEWEQWARDHASLLRDASRHVTGFGMATMTRANTIRSYQPQSLSSGEAEQAYCWFILHIGFRRLGSLTLRAGRRRMARCLGSFILQRQFLWPELESFELLGPSE
jgi:hypothetical protein